MAGCWNTPKREINLRPRESPISSDKSYTKNPIFLKLHKKLGKIDASAPWGAGGAEKLDWSELQVRMAKCHYSRYNSTESPGEIVFRGARDHLTVREPPSALRRAPESDTSIFQRITMSRNLHGLSQIMTFWKAKTTIFQCLKVEVLQNFRIVNEKYRWSYNSNPDKAGCK